MTSQDLTFDPVKHEYSVRGVVVPSVTQILKATGVSQDFDELPRQDRIKRKRDIGTALHADSHAYDDGDLDLATVHPEVRPYLDAWIECRTAKGLTPASRERYVFDPGLWYAGTLDGIFVERATGQRVLVDFCVGDPTHAAKRFQTAGYQRAYELEHPDAEIHARWAIELCPERRVPYRVHPYTDWSDFQVWPAIVTTYYARPYARRSVTP